ncbi:putative feruloyl esterase b precursor protein [Neofusicoccum parvum]|uniref:Feruloyl esterase b protein n=1 Tax=Neofusicoccum parvum TaxID=310453 RepID=A0ACB5SEN1_9PEZI|nr:putative feruloyl esterase b precursor protein [Neofusicoccum parvum]
MASKLLLSLAFVSSQIFPAWSAPTNATSQCSPTSFTFPELFGAALIDVRADAVHNYTATSVEPGLVTGGSYTINFCNVTVTYTHPGWNDTINVEVWLPLTDWNGRLMALGGGGYSASMGSLYQTRAVSKGYVTIGSDAGHKAGYATSTSPRDWALTSPGNVNLYLLENYASRSLGDMTVIGKAVTKDYYNAAPKFSYFNGCSGGGRQGFMLAQKYPDGYDGILAVAPALNIENFIPAGYWASQVMKNLGVYPPPCEIKAFTQAAIDACDKLDGVEDGIISAPNSCQFQAQSVVGQSFSCDGATRSFTDAGATIVDAAWSGPRSPSGNVGWFGVSKDADLTAGYVTTQCTSNNTCSAASSDLLLGWIQYFLAKDPDFTAANMTDDDFFSYLQQSEQEYNSMLGTANPDLSRFRAAGGKMISWHGLADEVIPPNGTAAYYQQALQADSNVDEFFRFFEAPGLGHCNGGVGPAPESALDQLIAWVEEGVVPETLNATGTNGTTNILCPYPSQQTYIGGDPKNASSYSCTAGSTERLAEFFTF